MGNMTKGYKGLTRLAEEPGFRYRVIPAEKLEERENQGWEIDAETDPSCGPVYYKMRKPKDKPAPVIEAPKPPSELDVLRAKIEILTQKVDEQAEIIDALTSEPEQKPESESDESDVALSDKG